LGACQAGEPDRLGARGRLEVGTPPIAMGILLHFCHSSAGPAAAHTCAASLVNTTCVSSGEARKSRVLYEHLYGGCSRPGVDRRVCRIRVGHRLRREGGGASRAASLVFEPGRAAAGGLRVSSDLASAVLAVVATVAPTYSFVVAPHRDGFRVVSMRSTIKPSSACAICAPSGAIRWLVRAPLYAHNCGGAHLGNAD
jgi:hypothetical protein